MAALRYKRMRPERLHLLAIPSALKRLVIVREGIADSSHQTQLSPGIWPNDSEEVREFDACRERGKRAVRIFQNGVTCLGVMDKAPP